MKIYSWNLYWRNKKLERAFQYIVELDFDILCMQEVPESFLERLKELPYEIAYEPDSVRKRKKKNPEIIYVVILSRYRILTSHHFSFPKTRMPLRTRLFIWGMQPFGWAWLSARGSMYADIETPDFGKIRVFSVHLTLSGPTNRKGELKIIKESMPEGYSAILCGDFNIVEHPFIKFISWILGSPFSESLPNHDERAWFEKWLQGLELKNPLKGKVTHWSNSQLDHILVPRNINLSGAEVETERFGSDHSPVFLALENVQSSG